MTNDSPLRRLPSVDRVLRESPELLERWGHGPVADAARRELADRRANIEAGGSTDLDFAAIQNAIDQRLWDSNRSTLRPVLNLSGTVLHTNLGRASLPQRALDAVVRVARQPSALEFDLDTGSRGQRETHIETLLCELTGAEAATAVNNNAAAVLLVLNTLALEREVPVSRGELVEIGGSFRIPEVMQRAGCKLVEIGATNRTHPKDYTRAIGERTALLMKVHTSNYRVEGFTAEVSEAELAGLAREHALPLVIDLGSGNLLDFTALDLPPEPTVQQAIATGADVVTFSGDKLLGGPQAGLIAGRRDLIEQIDRNPLKRALRLDKMTLAALEEVLKLYRNPEQLLRELPTYRQLTRPLADIQALAERLRAPLAESVAPGFTVAVVPGYSQIGSGALPVDTLPSACLQLAPNPADDAAARRLGAALRSLPLPVIGRLQKGTVILDLRCLESAEELLEQLPQLAEALA